MGRQKLRVSKVLIQASDIDVLMQVKWPLLLLRLLEIVTNV